MRRLAPIAILAALSAVVLGCSTPSPMEKAFLQLLPSDGDNGSVLLRPITAEANQGEGTFITLQIVNTSDSYVVFAPGYGARAFVWQEDYGGWSEIQNEILFPQVDFELGPEGGALPNVGTANFASKDPRLLTMGWIRILVQGFTLDDKGESETPVTAFVDVDLPKVDAQ